MALREMLPDAAAEREGAAFLAWAHREAVIVQFILYSPEDVVRYVELRRRGIIPEGRHWVLFVLGRYTPRQRSSLADLLPLLSVWRTAGEITAGVAWATCAFGPREIECGIGAAALGGHVRIGFENNLQLPDGRIARDNAELVGCKKRRDAWARSIKFLTFDTCQRPPRAVRTARALRAAARPRRSVMPVARMASSMGSVFEANWAAFFI